MIEEITSNIGILREIFCYLNLKDLLTVTKVCRKFQSVIVEFILKDKYKNVEAFKADNCYIVSNFVEDKFNRYSNFARLQQNETRMILSDINFLEFLHLNSNNIETFSLNVHTIYKQFMDFPKEHVKSNPVQRSLNNLQFGQLINLFCQGINLTEENLQHFNQNCPKLEKIHLQFWKADDLCYLSALPKMETLKCVAIINKYSSDVYSYIKVGNVLSQLQTQTCIINLPMSWNNTERLKLNEGSIPLTSCKELSIGSFENQNAFLDFNNNILIKLTNLQKLTLIATNNFVITKDLFVILGKTCTHLKYLHIQGFNIKQFTCITTLEELKLIQCFGLTWQDFQQILSYMKLRVFTSVASRYTGNFEYFDIASSVEHISLHYNILNNIKNLFRQNENNLKNLISLNWSVDFAKQLWINAENCPNLEVLVTKPRNLLFSNLSGFKFLKSLTLKVCGDLKISDLIIVLQHATLKFLSIDVHHRENAMDPNENLATLYQAKCKNIRTNLLYINICLNNELNFMLHFWLNLLKRNLNLRLKIKYHGFKKDNGIDDSFGIGILKDIISHSAYPRHLKSISICGYNVDCNEVRNNNLTVIENAKISALVTTQY